MELTKQFIITHKNGVIQNIDLDNTGRCFPGEGFIGAEFNTIEELQKYIKDKKLITQEEAKATKIAKKGDVEVDINRFMFDDNIQIEDK